MGGRHLRGDLYAAFLRGINVGGARVIPMAELRDLVAGLGCGDVRSHIASGNLLFRATRDMGRDIEAAIAARWGFDVPVMIRTAAELEAIEAANPFSEADGRRYLGFCAAAPDPARLDPDRSPPDRWAIAGREIYFAYPDGRGKSRLTPAYVESALGIAVTVRNWNTLIKMRALAE